MRDAEIVGEVAAAVGLAEGEAGVHDVIRAVAQLEPAPVRSVSRAAGLPVPIVAAVCNELRKRGVVSPVRPVRLTVEGRELFDDLGLRLPYDPECSTCAGRGIAVPRELGAVAEELAALAERAPAARVELDQSHALVDTKLRRVLALFAAGALAGK